MVCGIYIIIMEDYILREIDKIGKLIEALLQKAGILRRSGAGEAVCETAWTELAEALDLDIDTLLAREDFIGVLIREYGFSDENLEKFAELFLAIIVCHTSVNPITWINSDIMEGIGWHLYGKRI